MVGGGAGWSEPGSLVVGRCSTGCEPQHLRRTSEAARVVAAPMMGNLGLGLGIGSGLGLVIGGFCGFPMLTGCRMRRGGWSCLWQRAADSREVEIRGGVMKLSGETVRP